MRSILFWSLLCAAGSLFGGGSYAFLTNVLLATPCPDTCDTTNHDGSFKKPWFATLVILATQFITNGAALVVIHILRALLAAQAATAATESAKLEAAETPEAVVSEPLRPSPTTPEGTTYSPAGNNNTDTVQAEVELLTLKSVPAASTPGVDSPFQTPVGSPVVSERVELADKPTQPEGEATQIIAKEEAPVKRRRTCAEYMGLDIGMEWPMVIITVLDLATVFLQSLASLYIPASINSAMRGTLLLITAFLSRVLRVSDAQAGRLEWIGIWVSTLSALGIGATHIGSAIAPGASGSASVFDDDPAMAGWGLFFSLCSNFTLALGIVYETKVFEKRKPFPLLINCIRTGVGALILLAVLLIASFIPSGQDHGRFEDGSHTMCCLAESPKIDGLSVTLGLSSSISGISALYLSVLAGSNFRALVYVGRALFVWFLQLVVYYLGAALSDAFSAVYGRPWTLFSYPQAAGFIGVIIGGAITWRGKNLRMKMAPLPATT